MIDSLLVIGAGTMGQGIAQWFAQQGVKVDICDKNESLSSRSIGNIHASWEKLEKKGKFSTDETKSFKSHLSQTSLEHIEDKYSLVIEAIIENKDIKKELFSNLDKTLNIKTIFASNTSSIPITELAKDLSKERASNFLGLHFFNPATIMKLVEIILGEKTDKALSEKLYTWFETKNKKPAVCKDAPGFIVNRVARNFYGEPMRILGDFDRKRIGEVDNILTSVGGFRMGPFRLLDLIGIDVNFDVTCSVWKAFNRSPRFTPHSMQRDLVRSKKFGKKSKDGFYQYE